MQFASLAFPPAAPEVPEDEKEEDKEMQGEPPDTMTPGASRSSRGEKRTEAQEATSVEERVTMTSSTEKGTATLADKPSSRRRTEKTDTKSDDVVIPVETEDSDLLYTVNTLFNDETGEEAKPWSDESETTKILTLLDDPKEVKTIRQKEQNERNGVMTAVQRSEAAGKRVIQTRWVV